VPLRGDFRFPVEELAREAAHPRTRLVLLASPNNPTGSVLAPEERAPLQRARASLVVLAPAYREFATRTHRPLLARFPHLLLVRTFSKAFALAGLRIGWAMGDPETIGRLEAAIPAFSIDRFAQVAAEEILAHPHLVRRAALEVRRERERLRRALEQRTRLRVFPSQGNFLLVRTGDAAALWRALVDRGILVRDVSAHPALAGCLRITVGTRRENDALLAALREIGA
jgi:histidinol-phosphate aminotransferase